MKSYLDVTCDPKLWTELDPIERLQLELKASADPVFFWNHPKMGNFPLFPSKVEIMNELWKYENGVRVNSELIMVGGMRCIEENEYVYSENSVLRVGDIKHGDKILGGTVNQPFKFIDTVYQITFTNGLKIKVNSEHPFMTNNGWKKLSEISDNDRVEFIKNKHDGNITVGSKKAKLLGYMYSDGNLQPNGTPKFTNINSLFLKEVKEITMDEFNTNSRYVTKGNGYDLFLTDGNHSTSNIIKEFLLDFGFNDRDSYGKILDLNIDDLMEFVCGFFNGDGSLTVIPIKNRIRKRIEIRFHNGPSEKRAKEFQFILWRLGIFSRIEWDRSEYYISVSNYNGLKKLLGFLDPSKYPEKFRLAIKEIKKYNFKNHNKNDDFVKIKNIKKLGTGKFVGFSVEPSHEIISYCGMRTHNSGKTAMAGLAGLTETYKLLMMNNPQQHYHLAPNTEISNINVANSLEQAKDTVFRKVIEIVGNSPYFVAQNPALTATSLKFPKSITFKALGSNLKSNVGRTVKSFVADEIDTYDDPYDVYDKLSRSTSNFEPFSENLRIAIGSPTDPGGFLLSRLNLAREENWKGTITIWKPTWELNPEIPYDEEARRRNPISYDRDMGAQPSSQRETLFNPNSIMKIKQNAENNRNMFIGNPDWRNRWGFVPTLDYSGLKSANDAIFYIIALDPSIKHDAFGLSVLYLSTDDVIKTIGSTIFTAERGDELRTETIAKVVEPICAAFPVKAMVFDIYMHSELHEIAKDRGVRVEQHNLDLKDWIMVRNDLEEGRSTIPYSDYLFKEMRELLVLNGKKVDHPRSGCFTCDTRVALLDGTNPTFEELIQRYPNNEIFHVYSIGENGICVGEAHNPRITKQVKELVEITLDNYQIIRCTPEHLFMTIDQNWIQAKNLTRDISIMPLYRSISQKGGWLEYERLLDPVRKERLLTHQMVSEQYNGKKGIDDMIHHKDQNKMNNSPNNLEIINGREHARYHTTKRHKENKEYVKKLRDGHEYYRNHGGNEKSRHNMLLLQSKKTFNLQYQFYCIIEDCHNKVHGRGLCSKHYNRYQRIKKSTFGRAKNHRILSINSIKVEETNVYDLTVDKYHNFALTSGVFVHNSKDQIDSIAQGISYIRRQQEEAKLNSNDLVTNFVATF